MTNGTGYLQRMDGDFNSKLIGNSFNLRVMGREEGKIKFSGNTYRFNLFLIVNEHPHYLNYRGGHIHMLSITSRESKNTYRIDWYNTPTPDMINLASKLSEFFDEVLSHE